MPISCSPVMPTPQQWSGWVILTVTAAAWLFRTVDGPGRTLLASTMLPGMGYRASAFDAADVFLPLWAALGLSRGMIPAGVSCEHGLDRFLALGLVVIYALMQAGVTDLVLLCALGLLATATESFAAGAYFAAHMTFTYTLCPLFGYGDDVTPRTGLVCFLGLIAYMGINTLLLRRLVLWCGQVDTEGNRLPGIDAETSHTTYVNLTTFAVLAALNTFVLCDVMHAVH